MQRDSNNLLVLGILVTLAATVETEAIRSTVGISFKNELDTTDSSFSVLLTHFSTTTLLHLQQVQTMQYLSVPYHWMTNKLPFSLNRLLSIRSFIRDIVLFSDQPTCSDGTDMGAQLP